MTGTITPFPTIAEVARAVNSALGVGRSIKKSLDDQAQHPYTSTSEVSSHYSLDGAVFSELARFLDSEELAYHLSSEIVRGLKDYIALISTLDANGVERSKVMSLLAIHDIPYRIESLYERVMEPVTQIKLKTLITNGRDAIGEAIKLLDDSDSGWQYLYQQLTKEDKDKVASWRSGEHLPEISSLKALPHWHTIRASSRALLMFARLLDYTNVEMEYSLFYLFKDYKSVSPDYLKQGIQNENKRLLAKLGEVHSEIACVQRFIYNVDRTNEEGCEALSAVENIRKKLSDDCLNDHWCDFQVAKIHTVFGDLDMALECAKKAIPAYAYRSHNDLQHVLHFSLGLAASQGPDKVLCKNIRKLMDTFGFSTEQDSSSSKGNKTDDYIQSWEIDLWANEFNKRYAPNANRKNSNEPGALIVSKDQIKYSTAKPDKVMSLRTVRGYKRSPQLCLATELGHFDDFKRLLTRGAKVDAFTSSGDTALIIALGYLQPGEQKKTAKYVDALIEKSHKRETLNTITQKRRLNALHLSIKAGKPDIVKRLLELEADPNIIATTDSMSPLYHVISLLISRKKTPSLDQLNWDDPKARDAMNRHLNDINATDKLETLINSERNKAIFSAVSNVTQVGLCAVPLEDFYIIIDSLLGHKADPNQRHSWPKQGYTPLMMAAELGDIRVFEKLVNAGGNLKATYYYPKERRLVSISEIAESSGSKEVLEFLRVHHSDEVKQ